VIYDVIISNATIIDGSGDKPFKADVAIKNGVIAAIGDLHNLTAANSIRANGCVLAPGFIDVHTHDDIHVIRQPDMLPKISQGVTTVIVGNCGISASPAIIGDAPPDPMTLLGKKEEFVYAKFSEYIAAVEAANPSVNVAALIGHTTLRQNHMDRLDRVASPGEVEKMREQLRDALANGALGLSTGLAYASAIACDTDEVKKLAQVLNEFGGVYTTHLRTEFDGIIEAINEAFDISTYAQSPLIISHLKCAGAGNWGRSGEIISKLETLAKTHPVGCDCYPYSASSSTLDLKQVTDDFDIVITWSTPHPEMSGRTLKAIASEWQIDLYEAAKKLQPAGAVYHGMSEADVRNILSHPLTMVGSDGLPNDPLPHPRLWGAFPRVLGHYSRDLALFSLPEAVRKMTSLSADRFGLSDRGRIGLGLAADLVLFNPLLIKDTASFSKPAQVAEGIEAVWVNGVLSYHQQQLTGQRAGKFLPRSRDLRNGFH
jgi:N-acyl-D-amino-acid deacylase